MPWIAKMGVTHVKTKVDKVIPFTGGSHHITIGTNCEITSVSHGTCVVRFVDVSKGLGILYLEYSLKDLEFSGDINGMEWTDK